MLSIINAVSDEKVFRETLQLVKFWAMRKNIYSNILGYLGGVSLAIMVARVCQENKYVTQSAEMFFQFFKFFAEWNWPQSLGILTDNLNLAALKQIDKDVSLYDIMPVITPSYEARVSTYRITRSTFEVITKEIRLAREKSEKAGL